MMKHIEEMFYVLENLSSLHIFSCIKKNKSGIEEYCKKRKKLTPKNPMYTLDLICILVYL